MKNNLKHRTLLERGGLMIEALAMLGLIAVVTPTMYKKSAERTMEVDDINTATTIRSYVSAAESYMATNYVPLMKEFQDAVSDDETPPTEQYKPITNQDLADFLPYKFKSASSLYDYNEPKVTVVKNGNNLTAFLLFPAKGAGDDGLGQERTARIASLVGANGGYVRSQHNARGIGGIWSLNGDTYTDVFPSDDSPVYSIVASTPNAINGSTQIGEFENPKYLQRTFECPEDEDPANCTDERWRNTMRTDLYLGGYNSTDELPDDNPSDEKMHNIRNIGSLIVGAEDQVSIDGTTSYGLYIAEDIDNAPTTTDSSGNEVPNKNAKSNAYIGGSLMAGLRNFFVDKDNLNYGPRTKYNSETGEDEDDGYNFVIDSGTGKVTQYGDLDLARNFYRNDGSTEMPNITIGSGGDSYSNFVIHAQRYDDANHNRNTRLILLGKGDEQGLVRLDTSGTYDAFSDSYCPTTGVHGGSINIAKAGDANENKKGKVAVLKTNITGEGATETVQEMKDISHIHYRTAQNFPVAIGENTYVQGLLAADQLDTQKLRTASLSTGSEHVDDEFQWLNVDKNGVVIESTDGQRPEDAAHTTNTEVQFKNKYIKTRIGTEGEEGYNSEIFSIGNVTNIPNEEPWEAYSMHTFVKGNMNLETDPRGELLLHNGKVSQSMTQNHIVIKADDDDTSSYNSNNFGGRNDSGYDNTYNVNFEKNGVVNLIGSNLRVGSVDGQNIRNVFSVNATSAREAMNNRNSVLDKTLEGDSMSAFYRNRYLEDFDIAMHGNVLFTGEDTNGNAVNSRRYMSIGQSTPDRDGAAGIEIVSGNTSAPKAVLVNLSENPTYSYSKNIPSVYGDSIISMYGGAVGNGYLSNNNDLMDEGTVYIRKGGLDALPAVPAATAVAGDANSKTATEQMGFVAAGRFVANNRDANGDLVKVPDLIVDGKYTKYNSAGKAGRYDTYMVNPAYTSVMHDIKLTTRGGARLSDILPNFIIKSIYLSTNDKDDLVSDFSFQHTDNDGVQCGGTTCPGAGSSYWASPYTGYVPAPQCPPGYSRVLTFTPVSMYMAQAGQMAYNSTTGEGASHYTVEEQLMTVNAEAYKGGENGKGDTNLIEDVTPMYRRAKLKLGEESVHSMTLSHRSDIYSDGYSDVVDVSDVTGLEVAGFRDSLSGMYPYILTGGSKDKTAIPFTFQQNTWLKTLSVPMCAEAVTTYGSDACRTHYVRSWALLMGFVYTKDIYNKYLTDTTVRKATNDLYWNVFPVTKGSLEGTATTYCYFNRSNMGTTTDSDASMAAFQGDYSDYFAEDKYMSLETTTVPTSYEKPDDNYRKRLNDPTLKYTEEW